MILYKFTKWYYSILNRIFKIKSLSTIERFYLSESDPKLHTMYERAQGTIKRHIFLNSLLVDENKQLRLHINRQDEKIELLESNVKDLKKRLNND